MSITSISRCIRLPVYLIALQPQVIGDFPAAPRIMIGMEFVEDPHQLKVQLSLRGRFVIVGGKGKPKQLTSFGDGDVAGGIHEGSQFVHWSIPRTFFN